MIDLGPQIATQEWWSGFGFWLLVGGLIGDVVVLALPLKWGWIEKALSGFFTIVIAMGCAFEHVADTRIADLVAKQEASAGVAIASAQDRAATAMADAALLGVSQKDLHDFVTAQKTANDAAIADLKRNTAGLEKARKEATEAAARAKKDLADMQTALAQERDVRDRFAKLAEPRGIDDAQFTAMVRALKPFANTKYDLAVTPNDPDAGN